MKARGQHGKNPRSANEGTIREVKHPYPGNKLPVRGLFRMTALMVSSTGMTNVRQISHYLERKRLSMKQMEGRNLERKQVSGIIDSSFWPFTSWLQKWFSSFVNFRKPCFNF